ncbi:hypothetical protein [Nocardioides hwasunensis]|uniref:Peptidase M11 gametolysin domain-containing protein n=1 Tax=Nocardioides hwasunensis TaxID=397258 RepID=A0ABR8MGM3_9ACTN|nr:hypothetical protein [Nocardioides hwasunensis]MBD3913634.1 hypothetical protein [Nocardioides hwasunensis]
MSLTPVRGRIALAAAALVTAALLTPTQGSATAPSASGRDTVEVTGTVLVLHGEDGDRDRYSLQLPSGNVVELAEGFEADPLSVFAGTLAVPGAGADQRLTGADRASALRRASASGAPLEVVTSRTSPGAPAPVVTTHATYVAKVTNFGPIALTDAQALDGIKQAQDWWVGQSGGQIAAWNTVTGVVPVDSAAGSAAAGCGLGNDGADFSGIVASVGAQAFPGVDFSGASPNHLVVLVPDGCGSPTAGRARLGTSLASGGPVIVQAKLTSGFRSTLEHEYGHNLSLQHSNNAAAEYGDLYQVMGSHPDGKSSPVLGTIYRMEQGIIAAGEVADATDAGGTYTLQSRSSASGLRGVHFINPDDGKRYFVDYRDGAGLDANTCYGTANYCNYASQRYGQDYRVGLTIEREDAQRGAFLLPAPGNDGSLQAGESWTNQGQSVTVTANAANQITVTRVQKPPLPGGTAAVPAPVALREVSAAASFPEATAVRYQWVLNGQAIPQADDPTFTPTLAMAGGSLSVIATGYAVGRNPSPPAQSAPVTVGGATWYVDGVQRTATISGPIRVGGVLTVTSPNWVNNFGEKPADLAPVYKWTRNGKAIKGATKSTYRLTRKDKGKRIQVTEYPRASGYDTSASVRSEATKKIRIGKLKTTKPRIKGKAKVGKTVKAKAKGWTRGTKLTYRWFVGKKAIKGATKKKLKVTRSMRGKKLVVKVTGSKKGFKKSTVKSKPVKVRK